MINTSLADGVVCWCSTYQSIACLIWITFSVKRSSMWNKASISWYKAFSLFIIGKVWWCSRWLRNGRAVFSCLFLNWTETWKLFVELVLFLISVNLIFFHYVTRCMIADYGKTVTIVLNFRVNIKKKDRKWPFCLEDLNGNESFWCQKCFLESRF